MEGGSLGRTSQLQPPSAFKALRVLLAPLAPLALLAPSAPPSSRLTRRTAEAEIFLEWAVTASEFERNYELMICPELKDVLSKASPKTFPARGPRPLYASAPFGEATPLRAGRLTAWPSGSTARP